MLFLIRKIVSFKKKYMKIDLIDLVREIENGFQNRGCAFFVQVLSQREVKEELLLNGSFDMLTNEKTDDTIFSVEINESRFLNDNSYDKTWVKVYLGDIISYVCVDTVGDNLSILAIEVSRFYRNYGFGKTLVRSIEKFANRSGFNCIEVSPFDENSRKFWEYLGYEESERSTKMYKKI